MTALAVSGLTAGFGSTRVLHGVDLTVEAGTTTAVLGPSGCGKTTLLRAVAGFVRPDAGTVVVDDRVVSGPGTFVPAERRAVGYVAQEGALFPHLSVADNVAFGLSRAQRRDRAATGTRVAALLELVRLDPELAGRRPHELSGGQQQRVALARALAREPRLVLLDEPFSALDAGLRTATRAAVADALAASGVTVVLVTHDQSEALSFADRVAIMRDGRIVQVDAPSAAYTSPVDRAAAEFLGEALVLPGTAGPDGVTCALGTLAAPGAPAGGRVDVVVRPEQVVLDPPASGEPAGDRAAVVETVTYFGHDALVRVRLTSGELVVSRVPGQRVPDVGGTVRVAVEGEVRAFPAA